MNNISRDYLENIIKTFDLHMSNRFDYIGVMYANVFRKLCNSYKVYFDKKGKLSYKLMYDSHKKHDKDHDEEIKYIDVKKTLLNAYKSKNENVHVFCISSYDHFIIYTEEGSEFIINLCFGEGEGNNPSFDYIFTDNIEKSFKILKPWFEMVEKSEEDIEFGIATINHGGYLYTEYYDYEHYNIDIKKNYNDDIPYEHMCKQLEDKSKPKLMLFYGDPGTGKTSLIKHFIGKYTNKDFIFIDGTILASVGQDKLMNYFISNPNAVFILEDCEKALISRDQGYNPVMSVLLNLTDGIIGDILGIKFICTFNTSLSKIDKALLRKGRLSLKYEFKNLCAEKARKILNDDTITKDMSLADIYYAQEENDFSKPKSKGIGFG